MAQERTDKCPYKSRYGGGWISSGQWLSEEMCRRQAARRGHTLPAYFWRDPEWKREFALQARAAAALFELYSPTAIGRALRTPQGRKLWSLNAPWLDALCEHEQKKWEREEEVKRVAVEKQQPPPPSSSNVERVVHIEKNGLRGKL